MRADWMGSDQATLATEVGTNRCRALHSNHMTGHVWQEYGSETLRARATDPNIKEPHDGGRGYYRNISLLSAWAHAPFMHNNAIGPELCGKPANKANDFYRSPYVDANGKTLGADKAPACWAYDPSVDGRFKLYVASMEELLNPAKRVPKLSRFDKDVRIALGPRTWDGQDEKQVLGFSVVLPAGTSVGGMASFQHKAFVNDMIAAKLRPEELDARLVKQYGETARQAGRDGAERGHRRDREGSGAPGRGDPSLPATRRDLQLLHRRCRERRPSVRRGPVGCGQEGADRLRGDALRRGIP